MLLVVFNAALVPHHEASSMLLNYHGSLQKPAARKKSFLPLRIQSGAFYVGLTCLRCFMSSCIRDFCLVCHPLKYFCTVTAPASLTLHVSKNDAPSSPSRRFLARSEACTEHLGLAIRESSPSRQQPLI